MVGGMSKDRSKEFMQGLLCWAFSLLQPASSLAPIRIRTFHCF